MGRRSHKRLGLIALAVVVLVAGPSFGATLNKRARLRQGPSKDTAFLGWVEVGAAVTLEGEQRGWYAVRGEDGRTGYVWQEHLAFAPGEQAPAAATVATTTQAPPTTIATSGPPPTVPAPTPPPTIASGPTAPDAVAGELERLRLELARLSTLQTEVASRLAKGTGGMTSAPLASDGSAGAAATFLLAGAFVGLVLGYVIRGRRDRRSRIRL